MDLEHDDDVEDVESRSESESSGVSDVSVEDGGGSPPGGGGQANLAYDQEEKGGGALPVPGWSFHKKANICFSKRGSWSPNSQLSSS